MVSTRIPRVDDTLVIEQVGSSNELRIRIFRVAEDAVEGSGYTVAEALRDLADNIDLEDR